AETSSHTPSIARSMRRIFAVSRGCLPGMAGAFGLRGLAAAMPILSRVVISSITARCASAASGRSRW
ncbi:MAG: hypothetical protein ACK559_00160, partial [bacterium]